MINELGFDTNNAFELFNQNKSALPPSADPFLFCQSANERTSSFRSSNRKLRALPASHEMLQFNPIQQNPSITVIQAQPASPNTNLDDISSELKKYFFEKMKKKGVQEAEKVYDQFLKAGFSPKAAIALTDRNFFPKPHEKDHGNYLKNVIGNEFFKKEQAARKGKEDWVAKQIPEKINIAALEALQATSIKTSSGKSHKYHNPGSIGGYLLGVAEIIAGGAIMVTGGALTLATSGGFTIGLGVTMGTGASLIGMGIATTTANAEGASEFLKYDPLLDIINKLKDNPKKWDEPGSPPVRGDQLVGDGTTVPYPGFDEWKGKGDPTSGKGAWVNPETGQSLHPDLNHKPPKAPHWDYECPNWPEGAELYADGTWLPK